MNQLQVHRQFCLWYRYYVCEFCRFLCRMISRENCFNFFKIWWRCRVCILFECVLRVEEFVYEFQKYSRLKLVQPSFQIVIFREHERLYVYYRKWKWRMLRGVLFTCFCFLLRLIYSALHRYIKLARYSDQLEAEKYG